MGRVHVSLGAILLSVVPALWPLGGARAESRCAVELRNGLLTVHAAEAPLRAVLAEIAGLAEFEVVTLGESESPVTARLEGLPLAEGLERLLRNRSAAVIYDGTVGDRIAAVFLFGQGGGKRWAVSSAAESREVERLERVLRYESDRGAREQALSALGQIDTPEAVSAMERSTFDEDTEVRVLLTAHLSNLGRQESNEVESLRILGRILRDDPDPGVRLEALEALGRMPTPGARDLVELALGDSDENVVATATAYLAPPQQKEQE